MNAQMVSKKQLAEFSRARVSYLKELEDLRNRYYVVFNDILQKGKDDEQITSKDC